MLEKRFYWVSVAGAFVLGLLLGPIAHAVMVTAVKMIQALAR